MGSAALGATYHGQFRMGKRHGVGRLELEDGSVYVGEWCNDMARGSGFLIAVSESDDKDSFYVGDLYDGVKQGKGSFYQIMPVSMSDQMR